MWRRLSRRWIGVSARRPTTWRKISWRRRCRWRTAAPGFRTRRAWELKYATARWRAIAWLSSGLAIQVRVSDRGGDRQHDDQEGDLGGGDCEEEQGEEEEQRHRDPWHRRRLTELRAQSCEPGRSAGRRCAVREHRLQRTQLEPREEE